MMFLEQPIYVSNTQNFTMPKAGIGVDEISNNKEFITPLP